MVKYWSLHACALHARGTDRRLFGASSRTSVRPNVLSASPPPLTTDHCPKLVHMASDCQDYKTCLMILAVWTQNLHPNHHWRTAGSKNAWVVTIHPCHCYRVQTFWQKPPFGLQGSCPRALLHQHSIRDGKLQSVLYSDQRPLVGIKRSYLIASVGNLFARK